MMHGLHPFDGAFGTPRHARRPPAPPKPQPHIDMRARDRSEYLIDVSAPAGFDLNRPRASKKNNALLLEGSLVESSLNMREYVTRSRAGIYDEPSTSALVAFVPAGQLVRGSLPSSRGWIALDDDVTWMLDDGSLAFAEPAMAMEPVEFARKLEMPEDADLDSATTLKSGKQGRLTIRVPRRPPAKQQPAAAPSAYRVLHDPCVYVREARSLKARPLGYKRLGEVVHVSGEVDGWLKLAHEDGWMLKDGRAVGLGPLLAPVHAGEPKVVPAKRASPTPTPAAPRTVPATRAAASAASRPAARQAGAAAAEAAAPQPATAAKAARTRVPSGGAASEPATSARTSRSASGGSASGGGAQACGLRSSGIASLISDEPALLAECEPSETNVQSPKETVENWVAIDDGSFVPLVSA